MDNYKDKLKYYKYEINQSENYQDLTHEINSIKLFSDILFSKTINELNTNKCSLLLDSTMNVEDMCCMLIELILYGLDILSQGMYNIFDLDNVDNDVFILLNNYLKNVGYEMKIEKISTTLNFENYYCLIRKKYNYDNNKWTLMNYTFINNVDFKYKNHTMLHMYKIVFVNNLDTIFVISFNCVNIV